MLKYKLHKTDTWKTVKNEPIKGPKRSNKIFLMIILKPCIGQIEKEINSRLEIVERENAALQSSLRDLREQFQKFQQVACNWRKGSESPLKDCEQDSSDQQLPGMIRNIVSQQFPEEKRHLSKEVVKKVPDIAYLYSVPLIKYGGKRKNTPMALKNPIDAGKELDTLQSVLQAANKDLLLKVEIGTLDNLRNALELRPKILHISCHGGYEEEEEGNYKLYLYLENNDMTGVVEKYDADTIRKWFSPEMVNGKEIFPRLVFVSACFSQQFGEIFREAGIPNVIAINSHTQIADEAATRFAKTFYHFLVQGKTVKEAFEKAKQDGKLVNRKIKLCCCSHRHKSDCKWIAKIDDKDTFHTMHVPECSCNFGGNTHLLSCPWVKEMQKIEFEVERIEGTGTTKLCRVCCCSPLELPHSEEEKFILISQNEEAANEVIFNNVAEGEAIINKCFTDEQIPALDEVLIGRNIEMQRLVNFLASTKPGQQLACVIGPQGVGKTLTIRNAVKYTLERGRFPDGFNTISLTSITRLCSSLNGELLPLPNTEAKDLSDLSKKIRPFRKLILLESDSVMETNAEELVEKLRIVLRDGVGIKIIITTKKEVKGLIVDDKIMVKEDLDKQSAYNIIKLKYPEWSISYLHYEKIDLSEKLKSPWLIIKAAHLLKDSSHDEVYNKLCKEKIITNEETKNDDNVSYVNSIADVVSQCGDTNPLFLLCQMPSGLLYSSFVEVVEKENDWLQSMKAFISEKNEPNTIIVATPVQGLKGELHYKQSEAAFEYINQTLLGSQKRVPYQIICLGKLASISRKLVRSYNFKEYKSLRYNEFSAIVDDGIWAHGAATTDPNSENLADLPTQPLTRFNCDKDNFTAFLDPKLLEELIKEKSGPEIESILDNIKELSVCTVTLLLHFGRPRDAEQIADAIQGFANKHEFVIASEHGIVLKKKFQEIKAILKLMKAAMSINQNGVIGKEEAKKEAEDAEELFSLAKKESIGVGEAFYLQAVLLLSDKERRNDALTAIRAAKDNFVRANYQFGLARALIAESMLWINRDVDETSIEMLTKALEIIQKRKFMESMEGECYCERAKHYEFFKKYEEARQDLLKALEKFKGIQDTHRENACNSMLSQIAEEMQQDCPLFAFLKAFPIIKKPGPNNFAIEPLEPHIRQPSFFRPHLNSCFQSTHKAIKVHFDILSLNTICQVLTQGCAVLHISSDHYEANSMSMEGELGSLEQISLKELKEKLSDIVMRSQCKIIVVAIPDGEEIANIFVDLGVPHVVCFKFSEGKLSDYDDRVHVQNLKYASIYEFCIEFYKNLLESETVIKAWHTAKCIMDEYVKIKGDDMQIPNLHYEIAPGAVLLPCSELIHDIYILPNLKEGTYVDTSPKRGRCEVDKERMPFVGRQKELYKIAKTLVKGGCVNLYGQHGVGKTRFAKEIAYFLYTRCLFKSGIYFRDHKLAAQTLKSFIPTPIDSTLYDEDSRVLIILDDMDSLLWKKEKHFYQSLNDDRNCVFLYISLEPLEELKEHPLAVHHLQKFSEDILSVEFIFGYLEHNKCTVAGAQLGVEEHNRTAIREAIIKTIGFQQANGYPRLLEAFCKKIMETEDILSINLAHEHSIETKYRKLIASPDKKLFESTCVRKGSGTQTSI